MPKKHIHFEFNQELVKEPLLYQLNRQFEVVVNIRGASVSAEGGFVALELEGKQDEIDKVLAFLRSRNIEVGEGIPKAGEQ